MLKDQTRWRVKKWNGDEPALIGNRGIIRDTPPGLIDVWVLNMRIAARMERMCPAKNHYDDGALFIRPFSDLDVAASMLKCSKKRQVTEAMRQKGRDLYARTHPSVQKPRLDDVSGA